MCLLLVGSSRLPTSSVKPSKAAKTYQYVATFCRPLIARATIGGGKLPPPRIPWRRDLSLRAAQGASSTRQPDCEAAPRKPIIGSFAGCCARTACGQEAAAPPSVAINFRLAILIAIGPSSGGHRTETIARPNRQVCDHLHAVRRQKCPLLFRSAGGNFWHDSEALGCVTRFR